MAMNGSAMLTFMNDAVMTAFVNSVMAAAVMPTTLPGLVNLSRRHHFSVVVISANQRSVFKFRINLALVARIDRRATPAVAVARVRSRMHIDVAQAHPVVGSLDTVQAQVGALASMAGEVMSDDVTTSAARQGAALVGKQHLFSVTHGTGAA